MKNSKALYVLVFTIVAIVFALFHFEVIPSHLIPGAPDDPATAQLTYIIDLVSIIVAIGGCFVLLYWFRLALVQKLMGEADESTIARHHNARLIIWLVLMLVVIALYYEASFANNPKYSILILFIAGVFCWPSMPVISAEKPEAAEALATEVPDGEQTDGANETHEETEEETNEETEETDKEEPAENND